MRQIRHSPFDRVSEETIIEMNLLNAKIALLAAVVMVFVVSAHGGCVPSETEENSTGGGGKISGFFKNLQCSFKHGVHFVKETVQSGYNFVKNQFSSKRNGDDNVSGIDNGTEHIDNVAVTTGVPATFTSKATELIHESSSVVSLDATKDKTTQSASADNNHSPQDVIEGATETIQLARDNNNDQPPQETNDSAANTVQSTGDNNNDQSPQEASDSVTEPVQSTSDNNNDGPSPSQETEAITTFPDNTAELPKAMNIKESISQADTDKSQSSEDTWENKNNSASTTDLISLLFVTDFDESTNNNLIDPRQGLASSSTICSTGQILVNNSCRTLIDV